MNNNRSLPGSSKEAEALLGTSARQRKPTTWICRAHAWEGGVKLTQNLRVCAAIDCATHGNNKCGRVPFTWLSRKADGDYVPDPTKCRYLTHKMRQDHPQAFKRPRGSAHLSSLAPASSHCTCADPSPYPGDPRAHNLDLLLLATGRHPYPRSILAILHPLSAGPLPKRRIAPLLSLHRSYPYHTPPTHIIGTAKGRSWMCQPP